jgi:sensor histidine kinase YesM
LKKYWLNIRTLAAGKRRLYLLLFLVTAIIAGIYAYDEWSAIYLVALIWIITIIALLWMGNRYLFKVLDARISWLKHTTKRFFWQLLLSVLYSLCCINLTYYLFKISTSETAPDAEQLFVLNIYGLLFIIPVLSFNFGAYFMMQWKKAHIQADRFKEENLTSRLETLRMHIDPHFLFNNLNVLSALIDQKPATAQQFLDKFVDVYRYVLQYKKEELVNIHTELAFIDSYVFLLKKRFEEQCVIVIKIDPDLPQNMAIPPLSLQMLVENAVKHNKLSVEQPLRIEIFTEGHHTIVVRNNYLPKEQSGHTLIQSGLDNIAKRYQYLSDRLVNIKKDEHFFEVSLPLLEMEED